MKYFKNWSSEDFVGKWDGVERVIKAGKIEPVEDYLAEHFAKHLTDRELFKANLPLVCGKRDEFYEKCFADVEVKETVTEKKAKPRKGSETMTNSIPFEDLKK